MRSITLSMWLAVAGAVLALVGCGPAPSPDPSAAGAAPAVVVVDRDTMVVVVPVSDTVTTVTSVDTASDDDERPEQLGVCRLADSLPPRRESEWGSPTPTDSTVMKRGLTFRCPLRQGGREVRMVVSGEWGIPMGVDVFSPPGAERRSQQLLLDTDERAIVGRGLLLGEDLNDDGWTDVKVRTWTGSGGAFYDVFMYDPRRSAFVKDTMLSGEGGVVPRDGRPCVGTGRRSGAGTMFSSDWCWSGGAWVLERTEELNMIEHTPHCEYLYARAAKVRRNGRMQPVPLDTVCTTDDDG